MKAWKFSVYLLCVLIGMALGAVMFPVEVVRAPGRQPVRAGRAGQDAPMRGAKGTDEPFVDAVPAESLVDQDAAEGESSSEEVRDEDGLTVEERAEKFRRENPEEWERIQKRRRAARDMAKKAADRRQGFLDTINEEFLSESQIKTHAAYTEALAARNAALERIRAARDGGQEANDEDFQICSRADGVIQESAAAERLVLQEAAARSLGLSGDEIRAFTDILRQIDDATPPPPSTFK